ncbi:alpha-hydroxy-acid oxidizing protein [Sphingomonas histidinilytica]|nr:alpha-hydroxy-acid oxidizing protein [Rhizorhabdus histidinilytica]
MLEGSGRWADLESARRAAFRALPPPIRAYLDSGAEREATLAANRAAFDRWGLFPSVAERPDATPSLRRRLLGIDLALPLVFGPAGMLGLIGNGGDLAAARACTDAGALFMLSTASNHSIESLARRAAAGPCLFQLSLPRDRALALRLIDRARDAGFAGLCVTVDNPVHGDRPAERRHGLRMPPSPWLVAKMAVARPRWAWRMARQRPRLANFAGEGLSMAQVVDQIVSPVGWDDLAWLRDRWTGPLAVKGLLRPDDIGRAAALGYQSVFLSNQGGRHFDSGIAPLDMLPDAIAHARGRLEIVVDGGFRSGADVIKAIALGATACSTVRPFCYGLAAAGEEGVRHVFALFRSEMLRTLHFMGCRSLDDLGAGKLRRLP